MDFEEASIRILFEFDYHRNYSKKLIVFTLPHSPPSFDPVIVPHSGKTTPLETSLAMNYVYEAVLHCPYQQQNEAPPCSRWVECHQFGHRVQIVVGRLCCPSVVERVETIWILLGNSRVSRIGSPVRLRLLLKIKYGSYHRRRTGLLCQSK